MSGAQQDDWIVPDAGDDWVVPDAAPARPGLGDRFRLNAEDGYRGTLMGATQNYIESQFDAPPAPAILREPPGAFPALPGVGPNAQREDLLRLFQEGVAQNPAQAAPPVVGQQRAAEMADFRRRDAAMPSWTTAPTWGGMALEGGAALAGQLAGGMLSPENLVGPLAGGARRAGQGAMSYLGNLFARGAATQAPVAGVANVGVQGLDMAAGDKQAFSPEEVALATALGGALGGGLNATPGLARMAIARIREFRTAQGATPEQVNAPVTPEEALATWSSEDVRALAAANGVTDPAGPFVARIEERLGLRRAAEADPLEAARQRVDAVNLPQGQAPQTPAQQVARLLPEVEDQVAGEVESGMRFLPKRPEDPPPLDQEVAAGVNTRLRSLVPGLEPRPEPPPVIALPGENGRVRGQIIEPNARDLSSPREVTVPVRGTGEPGVQAGAELRTGQGTALVPVERPVTDPAPRAMDTGEVARAQAQNAGGTLPAEARLARVVQEVDADIAARRVPRAQRRQEIMARLAAQDIPEPLRVGAETPPRGLEPPTPPQTYAGQNREAIAAREGSRPSGNDRPPGWTGDRPPDGTPPPPTPRPPEPRPPEGGRAPEPDAPAPPDMTPWRSAADKATARAAALRQEAAALRESRFTRVAQRGEKSRSKEMATLDRTIAAKDRRAEALEGRAKVLERAMQDMAEGRQPPVRLAYDDPAANAPAVPGKPVPPTSAVQRIRELGGMRDDRGDFVRYQIPGLVNNRADLTWEQMVDRLAVEGYFPERRAEIENTTRPDEINTKNLLTEAIEETQAGNPRYTPEEWADYEARVGERKVAIEQAREVANALGLSEGEVRGLSRGQVADLLRDIRSQDELAALIRSADEAHAADLADFEARMNDPDEFNSNLPPLDEERARSRPATQEDIERVPPPDSESDYRPSGDGEAGGQGAGRPEGQRSAEGRGQEAQGQLDRAPDRPDGGGTGQPRDEVGRDGQGAGREAARAEGQSGQQRDLIPNERPAIQAQAARDAAGNKGKVPQKGVEDFALFDPDARNQKNLDIEGAAQRTADEVNKGLGNKLYGGFPPGDPDFWRFLFGPVSKKLIQPFADAFKEMNDARVGSREAVRAQDNRTPRAPGIEDKVAAIRWMNAAVRAVTYGDGINMRAIADRLPARAKAALHEFLDGWHANAGRAGSGKGATYGEGVEARFLSATNDLNRILQPVLKGGRVVADKAGMEQIVRLVQNPSQIRPGTPLHDAAAGIRDWLKSQRDYMVRHGVEIGEIKRGYFPRRLDTDAVWANQTGFLQAAERAYRASGMGAVEAKAAATAWLDQIKHNGADPTNPIAHKGGPGLAPDHVSERVLAKSADEHLSAFLLKDPLQTLVGYAHTSARRAELARVMGAENEAWTKLADAFRADGAEAALERVGDFVRTQTGHTGGEWQNRPGLQKFVGWVRLWGAMGTLSKAAISSLTEVFATGARSGRVIDSWHSARTAVGYWMGKESGERLRLLAEDIGTMTNHLAGSMAAARWTGGRPAAGFQAAVTEKYFRMNMLEQLTSGLNIGATGVGETFIRRMASDLGVEGRYGRQAAFALAELGIARDKHAAFAKWLNGRGKVAMTAEALSQAPKEMADAYRAAMFRFVSQSVMRTGPVSRPRWANNPLGSLAFHLSAYSYAVHDNVLLRAKRLYQNGDLTTGDKLVMSGKMLASLVLAIPTQLALGEARMAIYDSEKSRKAAEENRGANAVSRAGFFTGAFDPWLQLIGGVRYRKSLSESVLGPTIGRALGAATVGVDRVQSTINPFGPDKKSSDTEKRKVAAAIYDMGFQPAANLAGTFAPLPIGQVITQVMGAARTREAYMTAAGAPPPRDNRRRN